MNHFKLVPPQIDKSFVCCVNEALKLSEFGPFDLFCTNLKSITSVHVSHDSDYFVTFHFAQNLLLSHLLRPC